jgi:L-alanine-DL-glutamate epimerase-like enolase superfamily enzyme
MVVMATAFPIEHRAKPRENNSNKSIEEKYALLGKVPTAPGLGIHLDPDFVNKQKFVS